MRCATPIREPPRARSTQRAFSIGVGAPPTRRRGRDSCRGVPRCARGAAGARRRQVRRAARAA